MYVTFTLIPLRPSSLSDWKLRIKWNAPLRWINLSGFVGNTRVHNKLHNKDPVVMFSHLNAELLQIPSLRASFEFLKKSALCAVNTLAVPPYCPWPPQTPLLRVCKKKITITKTFFQFALPIFFSLSSDPVKTRYVEKYRSANPSHCYKLDLHVSRWWQKYRRITIKALLEWGNMSCFLC